MWPRTQHDLFIFPTKSIRFFLSSHNVLIQTIIFFAVDYSLMVGNLKRSFSLSDLSSLRFQDRHAKLLYENVSFKNLCCLLLAKYACSLIFTVLLLLFSTVWFHRYRDSSLYFLFLSPFTPSTSPPHFITVIALTIFNSLLCECIMA